LYGRGFKETVLAEVSLQDGGESEIGETFHFSFCLNYKEGNLRVNYQRGEKRKRINFVYSLSIAERREDVVGA
jgi:hypothetical protein